VAGQLYPKAGTYKLHRIQRVPSGWVLEDSAWLPYRLSSYTTGKVTLFSFFYGACRDPQGCPAAWQAFQAVHEAVKSDPTLKNKVRLVFLSLDPKHDTPAALSFYSTSMGTPEAPWNFLTTWSEEYLAPLLEQMYVPAAREADAKGAATDVINHLLKVFLIDKDGWVREVYTTNFLVPEVIMNDIRTVLLEED
jgi:cytochrome oxidase Cu insertion factor (SCO1/SenC/PrrC family)